MVLGSIHPLPQARRQLNQRPRKAVLCSTSTKPPGLCQHPFDPTSLADQHDIILRKTDLRVLTPLTYSHVNPYGNLDLDTLLPLT